MMLELLTVSDRFQLQQRGLVLVPDFAAPPGWKAQIEPVLLVTPDGAERPAIAHLEVWHFEIGDPAASADDRWRLVVYFPTLSRSDVPVGSRVLVHSALLTAIKGDDVAS